MSRTRRFLVSLKFRRFHIHVRNAVTEVRILRRRVLGVTSGRVEAGVARGFHALKFSCIALSLRNFHSKDVGRALKGWMSRGGVVPQGCHTEDVSKKLLRR